jgi:uncharacterized membrane protein
VDQFLLLRFAHLIGLMLMSAGLIGVFVADMRSRQVRDVKLFAQAVTFSAVFYDGLVVPGGLLLLASGTWLIVSYYGGWEFLNVPWLVGMAILFALEFIEGNTITRLCFMRLRRLAGAALREERVTAELASARAEQLASNLVGDRVPWRAAPERLGPVCNRRTARRFGRLVAELLYPAPLPVGWRGDRGSSLKRLAMIHRQRYAKLPDTRNWRAPRLVVPQPIRGDLAEIGGIKGAALPARQN